jgi:hypothetical protein
MLNNFTYYWNIARAIAVLSVLILTVISGLHAHGFAPTLDVKGPSKESESLKDKTENRDNKKAYDKVQKYTEKKSKGASTKKSEKPSRKDVERSDKHKRKHQV